MGEPHAQPLRVFYFHTIQWVQRRYMPGGSLKSYRSLPVLHPENGAVSQQPPQKVPCKVSPIDKKYPVLAPFVLCHSNIAENPAKIILARCVLFWSIQSV